MKRTTDRNVRASKKNEAHKAPEAPAEDIVESPEDYTVGRGKPPKRTQFKKGRSGNPKGRPKDTQSLAAVLNQAINGRMKVTQGGETRVLTKKQVLVLQAVTQAVQGDQRSLFKLLDIIDELERREAAVRPDEFPLSDADIEVMHALHARMLSNKEETKK